MGRYWLGVAPVLSGTRSESVLVLIEVALGSFVELRSARLFDYECTECQMLISCPSCRLVARATYYNANYRRRGVVRGGCCCCGVREVVPALE